MLSRLGVTPDFEFTKPKADTTLLFVHRVLADGDLYYVNNRNDRAEDVDATFRVSGREAELWPADTGTREAASFRIAGGRTTVPLHLEPWGAVFVVFRKPAADADRMLPKAAEVAVASVDGCVGGRFQAGPWRSGDITLDRLTSWSDTATPA